MNYNDDVATGNPPDADQTVELRAWQTPEMEIMPVSVTASGRGANCEGSVFTNVS